MSVRLALIDAIKRFVAGHQSSRGVEKTTYVFILVPFDFRTNGHARKTEFDQDWIDNGNAPDPRSNGLCCAPGALNDAGSRTTAEPDLNNAPELNHDLMWTWFLPNPL